MIPKLLCWLFGHKTLHKAFTGNTITCDGAFDRNIKVPLFGWEKSQWCLRCGKSVKGE